MATKEKQEDHTKDPAFSCIQDALKYAAVAANRLDAADTQLEIAFLRHPDWNSDVRDIVHEAQQKICTVLGTLVTWWDEPDEQ